MWNGLIKNLLSPIARIMPQPTRDTSNKKLNEDTCLDKAVFEAMLEGHDKAYIRRLPLNYIDDTQANYFFGYLKKMVGVFHARDMAGDILKEMDVLLAKKIEVLYGHIHMAQKEVDVLRKEVDDLQLDVDTLTLELENYEGTCHG